VGIRQIPDDGNATQDLAFQFITNLTRRFHGCICSYEIFVITPRRPDDPSHRAPRITSLKLVPVGSLLIVLTFVFLSFLMGALSIGPRIYILMVPVIIFALIGILRPNWGENGARTSVKDEKTVHERIDKS